MASDEAQVIGCHTVDEWKLHFLRGIELKQLVVVDFTATWCGPCRMISPLLVEYAKKMPHVLFLKVDVDELKPVAEEYEIEAMPTFIFFKEGKIVDKFVGAKKDELLQTIVKHATETATA